MPRGVQSTARIEEPGPIRSRLAVVTLVGMLGDMADDPSRAPVDAALANEWERMQGMGRVIRRKKIVAGIVASSIFLVGLAIAAFVVVGTGDPDTRRGARGKGYAIAMPLVIAWSVAAFVGKKMWPKGFGVR
jgi:hypothetical protein